MNILNFFKKDKSNYWFPEMKQDLIFDLNKMSINEIKLNDTPDNLVVFGKPSNNNPFKNKIFTYEKTGCEIEINNHKIEFFGISISKDEHTHFGPADLKIISFENKIIPINKNTSQVAMHDILGKPIKTDIDDTELIDFYEFNDKEIEIEYNLQKKVKRINFFLKN